MGTSDGKDSLTLSDYLAGVVKGLTGKASVMPCAVKTTKADATYHDRMEFLNEAQVMKKYKSHHIIELYGEDRQPNISSSS